MFDTLEADIVVMQETKIQRKDLQDDMVLVPGWDVYFSLPKHKKGKMLSSPSPASFPSHALCLISNPHTSSPLPCLLLLRFALVHLASCHIDVRPSTFTS